MSKNLLSRRQVMNMCKAVFDFNEYGIFPLVKDISANRGWRFLSYYLEISQDEEYDYKVQFIVSGYALSVYFYKVIGINKLKEVGHLCCRIDYDNSCLIPVYRSGCRFTYEKDVFCFV